jgi:hypothetical protein
VLRCSTVSASVASTIINAKGVNVITLTIIFVKFVSAGIQCVEIDTLVGGVRVNIDTLAQENCINRRTKVVLQVAHLHDLFPTFLINHRHSRLRNRHYHPINNQNELERIAVMRFTVKLANG